MFPGSGNHMRWVTMAILSVARGVPLVVVELHQLVNHVQQVVPVLLEEPLIESHVTEAHLLQHCLHGGVFTRWVL